MNQQMLLMYGLLWVFLGIVVCLCTAFARGRLTWANTILSTVFAPAYFIIFFGGIILVAFGLDNLIIWEDTKETNERDKS